MVNLFCLSHIDGDWFFTGPDKIIDTEFNAIVTNLLPEAAAKAMEVAKATEPSLITWREITKWIPELLKKQGFNPVRIRWTSLPHYDLFHPDDNVPKSFLGPIAAEIRDFNKATIEKTKGK